MKTTRESGANAGSSYLAVLITALSIAGCSSQPSTELPNELSAAQNCEAQGGKRVVERGPDGEIGICRFEDGRQCEEWALLLGRCPRGGIGIGAFATTSERHCAIRGGQMTIPGCALSPVGLYESTGGGERRVTLVLEAGRVAMMRTAYSRSDGLYLVPGNWNRSGSVVTVSTDLERLVFNYTGDRLVAREWDRKLWGGTGPGTLARQR
jgi:putative hemolysin